MTKPFRHHRHGVAGFDEQGAVGMADVVESYPGDIGSGDDPVERL
jgi:hypothetical protein